MITGERTKKLNRTAPLLCLAVMLAFSAKTSNAYVTDDTHIEHKNGTCALTEDELDEVLGDLEEVEPIKSVIGDM